MNAKWIGDLGSYTLRREDGHIMCYLSWEHDRHIKPHWEIQIPAVSHQTIKLEKTARHIDAVEFAQREAVEILRADLRQSLADTYDHEVTYALDESRRMTDDEIAAAIEKNRTAYEQRFFAERVRLFNDRNLIPIGNSDPYEVYSVAGEALEFLANADMNYSAERNELVKKLTKALMQGAL